MKKLIIVILFVVALHHGCSSDKSNSNKLNSTSKEQIKRSDFKDSSLRDSLPFKTISDLSQIEKDSIIDGEGKILLVLEKFSIKDTVIDFNGNKCYDIGFNISCYNDTRLLFSKVLKKKDFYHLFKNPKGINFDKYMLESCSIMKSTRNPFCLSLSINICRPMSDDCFDFILQFDVAGNYTMQGYDPENG